MMPVPQYSGETVAVFGLGRSGLAAARALDAGGAKVLAWDDSEAAREAAGGTRVALSDLYQADWSSISALVLSPGVPLTHPQPHALAAAAKDAGRPVIGDVELFAVALGDLAHSLVVAVTGTNGKSTTAALIGHIMNHLGRPGTVAGNIGEPVLAIDPLARDGVYVLELSSYQIDLTASLVPDIAVLLNISPDHLDRHGGMAGYVAVKERLFANQGHDHTAIVGVDDAHAASICERLAAGGRQRVVPVSARAAVDGGVWVDDGILYDGLSGDAVAVGDVTECAALPGRHNWQNAAAAYATARVLGLEAKGIFAALRAFPGLAHRLETVAEIGGIRFINDSKATNAAATARALDTYDDIYWIAGGRPKAGGIESLKPYLGKIHHAYLIGEASPAFSRTLEPDVAHDCCGTLEKAVTKAASDAIEAGAAGAVVLLSPACASFDQFEDFEARGEAFRALTRDLAGSAAMGMAR